MKQTAITLQNPQAAVHGFIPSVPHSRRAVEENYPIASAERDGPKNPGSARQTYEPDHKDAPTAPQPPYGLRTTFVRPSYHPCTGGVRVLYGLSTPQKGPNTGKYG